MVAIVAGSGYGLFNASSNILGGSGVLGRGVLGQSGGRSFVNAATGNLILQGLDEQLSGRGVDLNLLRTYNSAGTLTTDPSADPDVDGNKWRWDAERAIRFSGATGQENKSGSVTRTAGDGHVTEYLWVSEDVGYRSTDGDGAHDTVKFTGTEWVWTDGSTRLQEHYGLTTSGSLARLVSQNDSSGNKIIYGRDDGGRLTEVIDFGSGQKIALVYAGTALSRVETYELLVHPDTGRIIDPPTVGTTPIRQVEYVYDNGRIGTVKTILNTGGAAPVYYFTTYTYASATSALITNIAQSDGTSVSFTYYPTGSANAGKLWTVVDANGKQTFDYFSDHTDITIAAVNDANPQVWTYWFDGKQQLTRIESPAVGGTRLTTLFEYETNEQDGAGHAGNVKRVTQVIGGGKPDRVIEYRYDANGNRTRETELLAGNAGNVITRTYDAQNQLLSETHYKSVDANAGDDTPPADPMTVHYIYDSQARLRFVVGAEGGVRENRYDAAGLLERTLAFTAFRYTGDTFSESALAGWVRDTVPDQSKIELTQFGYDFRGNLSRRTAFASVDTAGNGVLDDPARVVTEYTYDGHGQLVHTYAMRGTRHDVSAELTSFEFDGLGRETKRVTSAGTQTTRYNGVGYGGAANGIQVTMGADADVNRLVVLSTFDGVGRLTSVSRAGNGTIRETKYLYDAQGRLVLTIDPQGTRRFSFFDAAGQLTFRVDSNGSVTGYTYNGAGQVLTETHYAKRAGDLQPGDDINGLTDEWLDDEINPTKVTKLTFAAGTDVPTDALDRTATFGYDRSGRLTTVTDAVGTATTTSYDGASRVTQSQTGERITRYFYDSDGRRVGTVDALGFLTENKFDAAGRLIESIRYTHRGTNAPNVSAPLWLFADAGVIDVNTNGNQLFTYRLPALDADGDALDYAVVGPKPNWLTVDHQDGEVILRGTPPAGTAVYTVTVRASDQRGTTPRTQDVTVNVHVGNSAPTWTEIPDTAVHVGTAAYRLLLPAADDSQTGVTSLVYTAVSALPPGLTLESGFPPALTGTPTMPGTYTITLRVADGTDADSLYTERTFTLTVTNRGPHFSGPMTAPVLSIGQSLNLTIPEAIDPEGEAMTYSLESGPSWLTLDGRNLSGVVAKPPGAFSVVIRATDPHGASALLSFTLSVANKKPLWDPEPVFYEMKPYGAPLDLNIVPATDPDGDALTYTKVGGPDYFSVDPVTGHIVGAGIERGQVVIRIRASDGKEFRERNFVLSFDNYPPVHSGEVFAPEIVEDTRKEVTFSVGSFSDANLDALTYSISATSAGNPASSWLDFKPGTNHTVLTGKPPDVKPPGSKHWRFVLTATDPTGLSASIEFDITVQDDPDQPGVAARPEVAEAAPAAAVSSPDVLEGWRPTNTEGLHTFYYYDAQGRVTGTVDPRGALTETVYDDANNLQLAQRYLNFVAVGAADTLTDVRNHALANGGAVQTTKTEFDALGRVRLVTGADQTKTHSFYDAFGRLVRQVHAEGQLEADGTSAERASDVRFDAFGEVTGTLGGVGDLWLANHPGSTLDQAISQFGMRYEFDSLGRRTRALDANGHATLFYYDRSGNLRFTVNAKGEISETEYDSFGAAIAQRLLSARIPAGAGSPLEQLQAAGGGAITALLEAQVTALKDDAHDEITRIDYDERGLVRQVTDGEGFVTTSTYTAFGQLESQVRTLRQAQGGAAAVTTRTRYDYDLDGQLLATTRDADGLRATTMLAYDAYGRVIRSVDAAGKVTRTDYLDGGRAIELIDALGRRTRTEYDVFSRTHKVYDGVQMTLAEGQRKPTVYEYDDSARQLVVTTPEGVRITTSKTRSGETSSLTDGRQNTTSFSYDQDGRLLVTKDALQDPIATNEYDASGRLTRTRDARNTVTEFSYDEVNRVVTVRHDPAGINLRTDYEFDTAGRQITVTQGEGTADRSSSIFRYDRNGRLARTVVDPAGLALLTKLEYDGDGNTVTVSLGTAANENQQVTQYVFDALGRRVREIVAPSSVVGAGTSRTRDLTTEYRYDVAGRVSRRIDANGQSTWFVYDAAGQLAQTIDALGEVTENGYDADGRIVQTRRYRNTVDVRGFGDRVEAVNPAVTGADQRSVFAYDADGHQRFTLQAINRNIWIARETRFDAAGNVVETRAYDQFIPSGDLAALESGGVTLDEIRGELVALGYQDASLGAAGTDESTLALIERTRFAFDANNRLRFAVDALGGVTENVYDTAGNLLTQTQFAKMPSLTAFDEATIDGAVDRADANNRVTKFGYDAAGRLRFTARESVAAKDGAPPHWLITEQVYDALGRVVQTTAYANEITTAVDINDPAAVAAALVNSADDRISGVVFDHAGRQAYSLRALVVTANRAGMKFAVTRHTYDSLGHAVQVTAFAKPVTLGSLALPALDSAVAAPDISGDPLNRTTRFAFDAAGRMRFAVGADGSLRETVYDALGRVAESRQFDITVPVATQISDAALTALRGTHVVGDGATRGERYTYDAMGRLLTTTDAAGFSEIATYDALGNRATFIDKNGAVELGRHQNDDPPFDLDRVRWTYNYDLLGRVLDQHTPLARFQLNGEKQPPDFLRSLRTHYTRDAFGNLISRGEALDTDDFRLSFFTYDKLNRQISATLPGFYDPSQGRVYTAAHGSSSYIRSLETSYDAFGDAVRTKTRNGAGAADFFYEYKTYDVLGRIRHDVDVMGGVTSFDYDAFDDQTSVTRYSKQLPLVPPGGVDAPWSADAVSQALGTDAHARTVSSSYDNLGRKTEVRQPPISRFFRSSDMPWTPWETMDEVTATPVTRYAYDVFGDLVRESVKLDVASFDHPDGEWRDTRHFFDVMGRGTVSVDALGNQTRREFDAFGNLTKIIEYAKSANLEGGNGLPPAVPEPDAKDRITAVEYDVMNRRHSVMLMNVRFTDRDGSKYVDRDTGRDDGIIVSTLEYDALGHVVTATDALGNRTTTSFNVLGQRDTVTEPQRLIANGIDPFHSQIAASPVTSFTYNAFGQVVTELRSATAGGATPLTKRFDYDAGGNLVGAADANGNVTNFEYDFSGRMIRQTKVIAVSAADLELEGARFPSGASAAWFAARFGYTVDRRFVYDALGRRTDAIDVYQDVQWAGQPDGSEVFVRKASGQRTTYNTFGEVTADYRTWGPADEQPGAFQQALQTSYQYDDSGRMISRRSSDGETHYFYDLTGSITRQEQRDDASTADGAITRITEFGYDALGRVVIQRLPGFMASRPSGTAYAQVSATPFSQQRYDRWGNVISRSTGGWVRNGPGEVNSDTELTITYEYNHDNKLIAEHLPTERAWVDGGLAQFLNVTHEISYDRLGRTVRENDFADQALSSEIERIKLRGDGRRNEYDEGGKLVAYVDATNRRIEYVYDSFGRRVGTRNAAGTVLLDDYDGNGNLVAHSILRHGGGTPYDSYHPQTTPIKVLLSRYKYDQADRNVFRADYTNDTKPEAHVQQYVTITQYDERNLVRHVALTSRSAAGLEDLILDRTYGYDQFGNKNLELDQMAFQGGADSDWNSMALRWSYSSQDLHLGRLDSHGFGNESTQYVYNDFGQIRTETTGASSRTYSYFANGLLASSTDHEVVPGVLGGTLIDERTSTFQYNTRGQMVQDSFDIALTKDGFTTHILRNTLTFYDEVGRIQFVVVPDANAAMKQVTYGYDELGNRRFIQADYSNGDGSGFSNHWFAYDEEDRVRIVDGHLDENFKVTARKDTLGSAGILVDYDAVGRRSSALSYHGSGGWFGSIDPPPDSFVGNDPKTFAWEEYLREEYTYTDLGYLEKIGQTIDRYDVTVDGEGDGQIFGTDLLTKEFREYDDLGHLRTDNVFSSVMVGNPQPGEGPSGDDIKRAGNDHRFVLNSYSTGRAHLNHVKVTEQSSQSELFYQYDDGGRVKGYLYELTQQLPDDEDGTHHSTTSGTSYGYEYAMGPNGMHETVLSAVLTQDGKDSPPSVRRSYYDSHGNMIASGVDGENTANVYHYDASGHIIFGPGRNIYYSDGHEVAAVGPGLANFSNGYRPVSEAYPAASPGSYVVNANDTLSGIAKAIWGDSSLWYLIADANNVTVGPTDPLPPSEFGRTYRIPNVVVNTHNNANTFKAYNPADIINNAAPVPHLPVPPSNTCSEVKEFLITAWITSTEIFVSKVVQGVLTAYVGTTAAATIGGVIGNVTRQTMEISVGRRDDFSASDIGEAAAVSAATAGLGEIANVGKIGKDGLTAFDKGFISVWSSAAKELAKQGIHQAFHGDSESEFDLAGFAVRNVLSAADPWLSSKLKTADFDFAGQISALANNVFNPSSGWAWNETQRTWGNIVNSAINSSTTVAAGALTSYMGESIKKRQEAEQREAANPYGFRPIDPPSFIDMVRRLIPDAQFGIAMNSDLQSEVPGTSLTEDNSTEKWIKLVPSLIRNGQAAKPMFGNLGAAGNYLAPLPGQPTVLPPRDVQTDAKDIIGNLRAGLKKLAADDQGRIAASTAEIKLLAAGLFLTTKNGKTIVDTGTADVVLERLMALNGSDQALAAAYGALDPTQLSTIFDRAYRAGWVGASDMGGSMGYEVRIDDLHSLLQGAENLSDDVTRARIFTEGGRILGKLNGAQIAGSEDAGRVVTQDLKNLLDRHETGVLSVLHDTDQDGTSITNYLKNRILATGGRDLADEIVELRGHFMETRGKNYQAGAAALGYFVGGVRGAIEAITADEATRIAHTALIASSLIGAIASAVPPVIPSTTGQIATGGAGSVATMGISLWAEQRLDEFKKGQIELRSYLTEVSFPSTYYWPRGVPDAYRPALDAYKIAVLWVESQQHK